MKYEVKLTKIVSWTATVHVEAEEEDEVEDLAINSVTPGDWELDDENVVVDEINEE